MEGYCLYIADTSDRAMETTAFYRFSMVLHDITLVFTDKGKPDGFAEWGEGKLPEVCIGWLKDCIAVLTEEYRQHNLRMIEQNDREFMVAFEKQLEFERQRTEGIADERNQ